MWPNLQIIKLIMVPDEDRLPHGILSNNTNTREEDIAISSSSKALSADFCKHLSTVYIRKDIDTHRRDQNAPSEIDLIRLSLHCKNS